MYEESGSRTIFQATRVWDHEKDLTCTGVLIYVLDQNTFFVLRGSYVHRFFPFPLQENVFDLTLYYEQVDLYGSLTTSRSNETYLRTRMQGGLYFTRFQDNFLGGNHEISGGVWNLKMPKVTGIGGVKIPRTFIRTVAILGITTKTMTKAAMDM